PLPEGICHVPFAPLSRILPRCTALVHHGGIGTVAAALAAGIPQVARPMSHDQADNATRVTRLGTGTGLRPGEFTAPRLAATLGALLASPEVKDRCAGIAAALERSDAIGATCDLIEAMEAL